MMRAELAKVKSKERLLQVVFQLRRKRKFDQGHRLEKLIDSLPDLENAQHSELKAVIEVLLSFAGSKPSPVQTLGYNIPDLPINNSREEVVELPKGHLYHGDSKYLYKQEGLDRYVHYPRELFEGLGSSALDGACGLDSVQAYHVDYQVLSAEPGKDLHGKGLFNVKPIVGNAHETDNRVTLFHALTSSKTTKMDIKLTVPALPDTTNPDLLGLKVPMRNEMSEDEGFHDSSSTVSLADTPTDNTDAFWDAVLNYKPNRHYTWETIGRHPRTTERPYLTEAGFEAVDELYKVLCHQASMLGTTPLRSRVIVLGQRVLVRDALHALIAVPSTTFCLDEENHCLTVNRDVCLRGLTPQSFHHLLEDFTQIGTDYLRLSTFAKQRIMDSSYSGGLVLQAFATGVRRFLQYYQALVQLVPPRSGNLTLLSVKDKFNELTSQLRYLSDLCMCNQRGGGSQPGDPGDPFPTGINLLSYLYQEALDCRNIQKYRLVLSLLRLSCGPYLMHVQDWVFHGICHDVYGEFMITINDNYLHYRDKHYWTDGYILTLPTIEDNVPVFLQDMAYDIYVCGKSINLLKLCCPDHFVCNPDMAVPRVSLTYSSDELRKTVDICREYLRHMHLLARMKTISREDKEQQDEEAKQALLAEARRTASQELKRIEDAIKIERMAADQKKREIFKELKEQMQKDIVRRALAVETERQEDLERIEELKRKEQNEAEVETELERQAREEIIEYYAKLTEQAAQREQRALWRIRRHRLDQQRIDWILQEEESLRQAMNLRSRVGILPTGSANSTMVTKAGVEQQDNGVQTDSESSVQTRVASETDTGMTSETAEGSRADGQVADLTQASSTVSQSLHREASDNVTQGQLMNSHQSPAVGVLISLGDSIMETGDLANEDIESTLSLIQGDQKVATQSAKPNVRIGMPLNLLDTSISDFLPREGKDGDEEKAVVDPEAEVEDVLLEIGSKLPTMPKPDNDSDSAAVGILDELLGLSKAGEASSNLNMQERERSKDDVGVRRKTWRKPDGTQTVSGHPSDSQVVLGHVPGNDDQLKPNSNIHGHTSDSHFTIGQEVGASQGSDAQKQNVHGHPSTSHFTAGQEITTEEEKVKSQNIHGHTSDSNFTVGQEMGRTDDEKQPSKNAFGHTSDSNFALGQDVSEGIGPAAVKPNIHGHVSESHFTEDASNLGVEIKKANIHGHSSDSTVGHVLHQSGDGDASITRKPVNIHGHSSDSTAGSVLYPSPNGGGVEAIPGVVQTQSESTVQQQTMPRSVYGHSSDSTIQSTMYNQHPAAIDDVAMATGARSKLIGHPSDSTAQRLLYGRTVLGGQADKPGAIQETPTEQISVEAVIWAGDGVELLPDVFDMFDASPGTDLLAATGYTPISGEMGDYGMQMSDGENLEADEKLSLPIIMKRSVTTPLLAQIGLVNQSMLDYYMVELGIDKHFKAMRSFLFLEDGEFGQSLCDQLFDKLAQGLRPAELLSPIVLNHVLPRAIQSSANRESEYAQLLGFSLKWLPPFFKPNAIDTFDCLELRYRVDWPYNIVITETCLIKYNKVFSFLLQLKRTSWVLRDIYFQLKRSATVSYAGNSPQFRQLQLFRHEMQHFVSVMQGYVVNQVIYVTWGEFQQELKTNVHNLDDLHQKHAEYLNKAVFRCLLNKKAATLMKIITDILCLILKVRTQLISSSWIYDQASHAVVHPAFQTIRSSYLAFKEYSGFLYKVVAKLVTRGYQPHLEEFLLRLNFNDFYEET
ncbi:gamma-tubulin complex component 6-like [Amphiura filiformis]|uniref:gamma-tubulin complex component 6-like n=1 Tax=Amphiura filiformis TaxID=82378 RepID=UPI003B21AC1D